MIDTSGYRRFERVDEVEETARGIEAALHGERLRVDVVRDDVVRFKISRGGAFDETPTFALCVDPTRGAGRVHRGARRGRRASCARARSSSPSASTRSGSTSTGPTGAPVIETAEDPDGRSQAYVDPQRRLGAAPALPAGGRDLRARREGGHAQPQGPRLHALEHRRARRRRDRGVHRRPGRRTTRAPTRRARSSTRTTSPSRSSTTTRSRPARSARRSSTTAIARPTTSRPPTSTPSTSRAASTRSTSSPARSSRAILEAYTWLTGRMALPPLWALGYHQCRWFAYTQDAVEALGARHRELDLPCDVLWLDIDYMDGYRVFTWDTGGVPRPAGDARAAPRAGLPRDHDHRPGREGGARLRDLRPRPRARRLLPHGGRRRLHRPGLARRHRVPRLRHGGGARVVGRAQRRPRAVGPRGHLERHERAGDRRHPAGPDALRPRPAPARALPQPVRAADGDGHRRPGCATRCPSCGRSC